MKRYLILTCLFTICIFQTAFSQTNIKDFTMPGIYKFMVPAGATSMTVTLWGAGGWGGGGKGYGGKGGFVSGTVQVKEGDNFIFIVGAGGGRGKKGAITAIKKDTLYIAMAAAGGNGSSYGGRGGDGGSKGMGGTTGTGSFQSGNSGRGADLNIGGTGGTSSKGANGKNGSFLNGGTNNAKAIGEGWGGDGWYGGGAAGTFQSMFLSDDPYASGGGGGGSNYTKGLNGTIINTSNGSIGGVGNNSGINGRISIGWK